MRTDLKDFFLVVCCSVMLAGCIKSSDIQHDQALAKAEKLGATGQFSSWPEQAWWHQFNDPELNRLIDAAVADGPSMVQAAKRVEAAAAYANAAHAALKPQLNLSGDITRQRLSENSFYPPPYGGSYQNIGEGQLNASWDIDFWGKNRAGLNAALSQVEAAKAEREAARQLVVTSVARTYFQLAYLTLQKQIVQSEVTQREQILQLIQQRVTLGLDTNVELRQGQGALPEARAKLEATEESLALTRNALAALVVQPVDTLQALNPPLPSTSIQDLPEQVPVDLIGRRPDLAAARARVEAATADVSQAQAEFYPNVSLTAFLGLSSFGLSKFLELGSSVAGVGPAVHLPIFDGGTLRANFKTKNADLDIAIASYNQVLIDAIHEVADQISSISSVQKQALEQAQALKASESAYQLAMLRYQGGLSNYLTVLSTEDAVLRARQNLLDINAHKVDLNIALIKALGGGFTQADLASISTSRQGQ